MATRRELDRYTETIIGYYKEEKCLWDRTSKEYRSHIVRNKAYQRIAEKLGTNWTDKMVQGKIQSLRAQYRRSLRKLREELTSDGPLWWAFHILDEFLRPQVHTEPNATNSHADRNTWVSDQYVDEPSEMSFPNNVLDGNKTTAYDNLFVNDSSEPSFSSIGEDSRLRTKAIPRVKEDVDLRIHNQLDHQIHDQLQHQNRDQLLDHRIDDLLNCCTKILDLLTDNKFTKPEMTDDECFAANLVAEFAKIEDDEIKSDLKVEILSRVNQSKKDYRKKLCTNNP